MKEAQLTGSIGRAALLPDCELYSVEGRRWRRELVRLLLLLLLPLVNRAENLDSDILIIRGVVARDPSSK